MIFLLFLLFFYLLILKGLPWVASKYASYRFGAHVGVKTIDFISRSLRDVTFRTVLMFSSRKKPNEVAISLGKIKFPKVLSYVSWKNFVTFKDYKLGILI